MIRRLVNYNLLKDKITSGDIISDYQEQQDLISAIKEMPNELTNIGHWFADFEKWYIKTYHLGDLPDSPYEKINTYALQTFETIFRHMLDDIREGRKFEDKSKEYFDNYIQEND